MSPNSSSFVSRAAEDLLTRFSYATGVEPSQQHPVALHEPALGQEELLEVTKALESGFVSSVGYHVDEFSRALAEFTSVPYAVPIVNGTSALQLALRLAGVGPGDEVAVPALSFVATANAAKFLGADPVFLDSVDFEEDLSLGISPESLEELLSKYEMRDDAFFNRKTNARLAAVVPMHTLGRITDVQALYATVADRVKIVEDAAEALGSRKFGRHPGQDFDAILSFNGNKIITTGGGGAFLTSSKQRAEMARTLSTTGKVPHAWRFSHSTLGWNFRMPAINAALGLAQMKSLSRLLESKRELSIRYKHAFAGSEFFSYVAVPDDQLSNNWLNVVRSRGFSIGDVLDRLNDSGLGCRPMWDLLPSQPFYHGTTSTSLKNATKIRESFICLPSSARLLSR